MAAHQSNEGASKAWLGCMLNWRRAFLGIGSIHDIPPNGGPSKRYFQKCWRTLTCSLYWAQYTQIKASAQTAETCPLALRPPLRADLQQVQPEYMWQKLARQRLLQRHPSFDHMHEKHIRRINSTTTSPPPIQNRWLHRPCFFKRHRNEDV